MKLFSVLVGLAVLVVCLTSQGVQGRRSNSDIIIMGGKDGWGGGMGNLIKTGGRRGGDTILLSGGHSGCGWW